MVEPQGPEHTPEKAMQESDTKLDEEQEGKLQTIGVKRSRLVFDKDTNEWSNRETIVYLGPCEDNAMWQFTMLYATKTGWTRADFGGCDLCATLFRNVDATSSAVNNAGVNGISCQM